MDAVPDMETFWSVAEEAILFKDETYGQWGLKILSPKQAQELTKSERATFPFDVTNSDHVIGEFYGDSDQLIIQSPTIAGEDYRVFVRNPSEPREEWVHVASSFGEFLKNYIDGEGDKFWESLRLL